MQEIQVQSLGGEDLTPVFLSEKSQGQRSLVGYSPWGCRESDVTAWLTLHFQGVCVGGRAWSAVVCRPADTEHLTF